MGIEMGRQHRRPNRPALSAHLLLDDELDGEVGILSEALHRELFPNYTCERPV